MVIDGLPDTVGESFLTRVDAADLPLQVREFLHHLRDEVGLAEVRRLAGLAGVGPYFRTDRRRDLFDAARLLRIVADLRVELEVRTLLETLRQRGLACDAPQ